MADKINLSEWARRAQQRISDKQVSVKFPVYVPSLDEEFTFRTLLDHETSEIFALDDEEDPRRQDKQCVYDACVEPDLHKIATELKEAGAIKQYLDVVDMFDYADVRTISKIILEQSGVVGGKRAHLVEKAIGDTKN